MEIAVHCFGASTPTGEALRNLVSPHFYGYSRNPQVSCSSSHFADLLDPARFHPVSGHSSLPSAWISFAPIWLFAPFVYYLANHHPERLRHVRCIIACSSSSVITKRFAFNRFDRQLASKLLTNEDELVAICKSLSISCCVIRPTMIYGEIGLYKDQNLSTILRMLRRFPLIPIPSDTGMRQPIHVSQLAAVAYHLALESISSKIAYRLAPRIAVGGDTTLSYKDMIVALKNSQPLDDRSHHCLLIPIPNRIFFLLVSPLLLISPKAYEAVLRISTNLSAFTPASDLLGVDPQDFPVL